MASGKLNMVVLMAIAVAAMLQSSAALTEHVVGQQIGWIVPSGANVYSAWAANQTFVVGDVLVFNFINGTHDVARVTKAAYESCNTTNTTTLTTTSPARINLSAAGEYFFLCTFPQHCSLGQKLAINVTAAAASPSPTPTASPPSPTPTASPPSPTASPPSPTASPPSPTASPPSPTASPPSPTPTASPPSPTASPPSPTASPPSPSTPATPPPTTAPPPSGSMSPPPPPPPSSSAPSFAVAPLPVTLLSIVAVLLY
ncbi:cucumber peeling cupredoxin-like [Cornus florida]|uniref:cucumber peeling cupredoxin-like n=1 Tax=Cornus florida TaxID=4283 RepID=UPI00289EACF3|nr:cucumber peeling cupredoxin-like [Cornus florida]